MQKVAISSIKVGFRTRFDVGSIAELAEDIKSHGLLHPIVVSKIDAGTKDEGQGTNERPKDEIQDTNTSSLVPSTLSIGFLLIAGYRRLKAAESLGWQEVPVTIIEPSADGKFQIQNSNTKTDLHSEIRNPNSEITKLVEYDIQLSENMNRKDLNPLELSDAILERKHRFEQVYGKIEHGGDHCSDEYQESKVAPCDFALPDFYETTGKLLHQHPKSIHKFLQLQNLDDDLKEKLRNRDLSYKSALCEQADRNRQKKIPVKKSAKHGSFRLPNQEQIAPFQKQYQTAPNLMQLFMLIQHSCQQVQRMQEKPLEYDKFELEYNYMLTQQMEVVMGFYNEVLTQLHQTQENKLKTLTTDSTDFTEPKN